MRFRRKQSAGLRQRALPRSLPQVGPAIQANMPCQNGLYAGSAVPYTEGVPGTIIDAYAAGLPIISAKWLNYGDILDALGSTFMAQTYWRKALERGADAAKIESRIAAQKARLEAQKAGK
mgnify:CR=1 FL=1